VSGNTFTVVSPLDGAVLATIPAEGADAVRAAVDRCRTAQALWARLGVPERTQAMRRFAQVLAERGDALADSIRAETGKPRTEALAEIVVSVDLIRFYAGMAARHLAPRQVSAGWMVTKAARVEREPYGVVGAITPWNYPLILALDCITPALFAGNGVVVKPSELTPLTTMGIPALLQSAGLPDDLVCVVTGDGATGRHLIQSGVDRVVFTGSTATGRSVMATAADTLTPVTLELGGKDPAIVLEDADLDRAARGVAFGAFFNAGQTCISVERVYVVRSVHDEFVARVVELAGTMRTGVGPDADMGPLISEPQLGVIEAHVADARSRGARVLCGGGRVGGSSRLYAPTVLVDVTDEMEVLREESFGPLLPIVAVDDEDEAVRRANDTEYGLFASVWTGDRRRGERVAGRLRAGGVSVNDVLTHYGVASLPVGGVGGSGFGRRRGAEALDEMSRSKTLLTDRGGLAREPYWVPYSPGSARIMRGVLDWRGHGGVPGLWRMIRRLMGKGA
jgi:acyl-CoA reductase-like NAD-dependent aldehyde dehydrogenase